MRVSSNCVERSEISALCGICRIVRLGSEKIGNDLQILCQKLFTYHKDVADIFFNGAVQPSATNANVSIARLSPQFARHARTHRGNRISFARVTGNSNACILKNLHINRLAIQVRICRGKAVLPFVDLS